MSWNRRDVTSEDIECSFCKGSFNIGNKLWDGKDNLTVISDNDHVYCNSICSKSHEKELIVDGKIAKLEKPSFAIMIDASCRDSSGELVGFNKPYYDRALRKNFNTRKEKSEYLKSKGLSQDGSEDPKKQPLEAGSLRDKSYRNALGL